MLHVCKPDRGPVDQRLDPRDGRDLRLFEDCQASISKAVLEFVVERTGIRLDLVAVPGSTVRLGVTTQEGRELFERARCSGRIEILETITHALEASLIGIGPEYLVGKSAAAAHVFALDQDLVLVLQFPLASIPVNQGLRVGEEMCAMPGRIAFQVGNLELEAAEHAPECPLRIGIAEQADWKT